MGSLRVDAAGITVLSTGYSGSVDLGGGALPAGNDTFIATFDAAGALRWSKTVTVGSTGALIAAPGVCGVFVATSSPSVNLGTGPLAPAGGMGVAGLGL